MRRAGSAEPCCCDTLRGVVGLVEEVRRVLERGLWMPAGDVAVPG